MATLRLFVCVSLLSLGAGRDAALASKPSRTLNSGAPEPRRDMSEGCDSWALANLWVSVTPLGLLSAVALPVRHPLKFSSAVLMNRHAWAQNTALLGMQRVDDCVSGRRAELRRQGSSCVHQPGSGRSSGGPRSGLRRTAAGRTAVMAATPRSVISVAHNRLCRASQWLILLWLRFIVACSTRDELTRNGIAQVRCIVLPSDRTGMCGQLMSH